MNIYIETYGCQMNLNDTEIISSILVDDQHKIVGIEDEADVVFLNTCSIRDNAERKIHERVTHLKPLLRKNPRMLVGILGCMAERLKEELISEKSIVKIVAGPDEYRRLPELIKEADKGNKGVAVELSTVETYDDIVPIHETNISGFISIMRGCNNFCTYCVVPYTRGRERSRSKASILAEVHRMKNDGFKEITLLGQNVNSYLDKESNSDFPDLLAEVAEAVPDLLIRYTTSHPKDTNERLIRTMASYPNICKHLHLPVQSGSSVVLKNMNRKYTAEQYLEKVDMVRSIVPDMALTTDIIAGFVGETLEDHQQTMELMRKVQYDAAFMFKYSPRGGTRSYKMEETIDEDEKTRRLNEIIALQLECSTIRNKQEIGKSHVILVENVSRRNENEWKGRTGSNKSVIFPINGRNVKAGDIFKVKIQSAGSTTLKGEIVED